ncbi:MAG: hypothetical protein AMJ54_03525 [Deltaproteobacteria bacterium SG8_13]|nr:MAG: hypothetical protein AMJ54_03525 [Deltaproteobacteria bacterium SG8_13]
MKPFWETKTLLEMDRREWELLCDGCGICCLEKLQDTETGEVEYTAVACRYLNTSNCRCRVYADRLQANRKCVQITVDSISHMSWLPGSCAYRRLAEGKKLLDWHPLISGDPETVHSCGISVRDRVISAAYVHPKDIQAYGIEIETETEK